MNDINQFVPVTTTTTTTATTNIATTLTDGLAGWWAGPYLAWLGQSVLFTLLRAADNT